MFGYDVTDTQTIPFYFKKGFGDTFREHFDKNFITNLQNEINKNNVFIVSNENNDKIVNLLNYAVPKRINMNISSNSLKKYVYIYFPKKCENL